jgi:hypothetical protein
MATVTYNPTYKEEKKKYSVKMPVGLIGTKDYEKAVERARTEAYVKNSNPSIKNTSNMSDADLNTYRYRATAMGQNGQEDYIDEVTGNPITAEEIQNKVAGTLAENYYPTNRQKQIESNVYNGTYTPSATDTFKDVYSYRVQNPSNGMKLQTYGTNGMQTSVPNAVNNPYQSQISNVQKAYEEMLRKQNRANDLVVEQGVNEYNSQKDSVNQNYDGMARDAYVTMMMGQKNMPQQLAANGIRGGGTETANLGLQTAYQNNLNSVEQNRANDIKSIDDAILKKPGRLTYEEYEAIKRHPVIGYNILKDVKDLESLLDLVKYHHERYDGKGYPEGKTSEELSIDVFIIQLADSIDAMATDRPYRKALSEEKIISEIINCSGTQFHPKVVEEYLKTKGIDMQSLIKEKVEAEKKGDTLCSLKQ